MSDGPNEVSILLHAHNHANLQETEKNKATFNFDFLRVKGRFNFTELFLNFINMSLCM